MLKFLFMLSGTGGGMLKFSFLLTDPGGVMPKFLFMLTGPGGFMPKFPFMLTGPIGVQLQVPSCAQILIDAHWLSLLKLCHCVASDFTCILMGHTCGYDN